MTKDQLNKLLDDQERTAAERLKTLPPAGPVQPRKPHPDDGRTVDRASGREFMLTANIVSDPNQPRKQFDAEEIQRLGASLREGQLQPLIVEWEPELLKWQIVDGEQRWLGAQAAKVERLWCMFSQKKMTPGERLKMQLKANLLRTDLKDIERARGFKRLMDSEGWTQQKLADEMHLSQGTVARTLQLLDLPPMVQAEVIAGTIAPAVAIAEAVKKKRAAKGKPAKPSKIIRFKGREAKGTLTFKRPPTGEQVRAVLVEWLDSLGQQQSEAREIMRGA